jgi:ATP-binding cassette subfamily F protein 3
MHRVATHVIEVRAGKVASYPGDYDEYVYRVTKEIDTGLRAPHAAFGPGSVTAAASAASAADRKARARSDREGQKKLKAVERKIARLDDEKRQVSEQLLEVTDATEAKRLQSQFAKLTSELAELEEEWLELSAEMESA